MEYFNRLGTYSYKWDGLVNEFGEKDLLAMWVADMDFASPKCARDALHAYVEMPLGYFKTPESYYQAVIKWEKEQHNYDVKREWICITPGIVPALYWAVNTLTEPGDSVLVSTPVYYPFMSAVRNNEGRKLVECPLKRTGMYYEYDLETFEQAIIENNVKLYILCNPHNPVGRVWTKEELYNVLSICKKYNVKVISDEIHQDIVDPQLGRKKVTSATVGDFNDMVITMSSCSKTFNLAAVQNSFIIIPNNQMRESFATFLSKMSLDDVNGFGHIATEAVMKEGKPWLNDVLNIIYDNFRYMKERFANELPDLKLSELEGTYLVWMDFSSYVNNEEELKELIQKECKLALDYGSWFGGESCATIARMNIATSLENVKEACDRIINVLKK